MSAMLFKEQLTVSSFSIGLLVGSGYLEEIDLAVKNGFEANGMYVQPLSPDKTEGINDCDFLLIANPMLPQRDWLLRLRSQRARSVFYWNTEQTPNPDSAYWFDKILTKIKIMAELDHPLMQNPIGAKINHMAGRHRVLGELMWLEEIGLLGKAFHFTEGHTRFYQKYGIPSVTIPMGYDKVVDGYPTNSQKERDIDVLFLGSLHDKRRTPIAHALFKELAGLGIRVEYHDGSLGHEAVFGNVRNELLNRSKIYLGLMRQPYDDHTSRIISAAGGGCAFVGEQTLPDKKGVFTPGEHFVEVNLLILATTIEKLLKDPKSLQELATNNQQFVFNNLTAKQQIAKVIEEMLKTT